MHVMHAKPCVYLTIIQLLKVKSRQLSPEGEVNSGGYIPRREASRYISTTLHRPQFLLLKLSRNGAPFFPPFAKQWISKDIPSYGSQSKRTKIAIHWFGKHQRWIFAEPRGGVVIIAEVNNCFSVYHTRWINSTKNYFICDNKRVARFSEAKI